MPSGNNSTIGGGGFHHVAIRVRDWEQSLAFYTLGLGMKMRLTWGEEPHRAAMLDVGSGDYLELFERAAEEWKDTDASILHFALRTTDTDAALERARGLGAKIVMEPKSIDIQGKPAVEPVRIAFCKGPDGEVIEFFQSERL
ncbi:MAG: VOC family protein [Planctomycetes bacterium]|nr:VOC family protein [Planctomycetota bacterium]